MNRKLILIVAISMLVFLSVACLDDGEAKWKDYYAQATATAAQDVFNRSRATAQAKGEIESYLPTPQATPPN